MSASAVPMKQLSSPAHCRLNSLRTAFTAQSSLPFLSTPLRPIRILSRTCLSSSSIHWRAFLRRKDSDSKVVPFVAQTSDWARQSEDQEEEQIDEKVEAELDWENQQPGEDIEADEKAETELDWENQQLGEDIEARGSDEGWEETSEGAVEDGNEVSADGQVLEEGGGEVYSEPPEEAKVFVGNIPYDIDSEGLAKVFEPAGFVEIAEVIYSRGTGQSRGFGFITMSTVEEAEKAVEMFHRYVLNGRLLAVNKAAPRGAQPPERTPRAFDPSHKIYVGNLPWDVDDSRLGEAFRKYGEVVNARVIYERETNRSRGFGFVTMSNEEEMNKAVSALDGQDLGGRPMRVSVAEERPRPGSFF